MAWSAQRHGPRFGTTCAVTPGRCPQVRPQPLRADTYSRHYRLPGRSPASFVVGELHMNEIHCTVIGNVVTDVRLAVTKTGHSVASFRMASTTRRLNRDTGRWEDVDTSFLNVTAWRSMAEHVAASVHKGDPVTVVGRLRVREYLDTQGRSSISVDVEATSVGHDLGRGVSTFERVRREEVIPEPIDISEPEAQAA